MAGTIKLDGTQFLEKVNNEFKITNSELKLKSTGNTIVDSSGNAVVSESGGTVTLTADEANVGSNALVVNSSGNVGVGTNSPSVKLQSTIASSGVSGVASTAAGLFENSGNADVVIAAGTSSKSRIAFGDSGDWIAGRIDYDHSDNSMRFGNAGLAEQMRIDSSGNLKFNSGYGSVATAYGCRAWVNFNGSGTVAIRASGNVSSITDLGTGSYRVNFASPMPDTNYSWAGGDNSWGILWHVSPFSTTQFGIGISNNAGGLEDRSIVSLSFFR